MTGFLIARADEHAKAFRGQLPRNLETDSFISAGDERDLF
jgi:hypothetical protein